MHGHEVRKLAALEDRHWWYAERRRLLGKMLDGLPSGTAVDVGAAGGGNTRVLLERGWNAAALEYGADGAAVCAERGVPVARGDAAALPLAPQSLDLIVAFDVLEHIEDDKSVAGCFFEALRPGGHLFVAVPADPKLWSAHDEAVGHVRRYTRQTLGDLLAGAGFELEPMRSWNVLLRPAVALKRRSSTGSDLDDMAPWLNRTLHGVVALERRLPLHRLPGVSLLVKATRP